ncbi:LLM class flavin-dependent oxidoreductase [Egibacter rhizosphaerae]|uniref:LLM class flavin-dependent oxidoreductase n=1 Tax=Egibacter rhizosphaerae TaxID=1670831 RepID=A0A411YGQ6_9ACTN|nr:LLM class flavin-dependent oxidoreductase [Egibacter rhizosphaerae]
MARALRHRAGHRARARRAERHAPVRAAPGRDRDELRAPRRGVGGRATLGLGRGSLYSLIGERHRGSLQGLTEAVHVCRMLLEGDDTPWQGEVFALGPGHGLKFGTRRRVPISLGVFGPKGCRRAGAIADGVRAAAQWDPAYMSRAREWIAEGAREAGRDPSAVEVVLENWTCLDADRERARARAREVLATFLPELGPLLSFYEIPDVEVQAARDATVHGDRDALATISEQTIDRFMAAGDADDLRRGLGRLEAAGFDAVSFSGILGPRPEDALEILGAEIARRAEATR